MHEHACGWHRPAGHPNSHSDRTANPAPQLLISILECRCQQACSSLAAPVQLAWCPRRPCMLTARMASTELLPRCQDMAWPFPSSRTYLYSNTAPAGSCKARCHLCPGVHCSSGLPDRVQAPAGNDLSLCTKLPLALWTAPSCQGNTASSMSILAADITA